MKNKKKNLINLGIVVAAGLVLTWVLEYRCFQNDTAAVWNFIWTRPMVYLLNVWLMTLIVVIICAAMRRTWVGIGIVSALVLIVGYIDATKMKLRGTPLLPEDLQLADEMDSVVQFANMGEIIKLIIAIVLTIILVCFVQYLTKNTVTEKKKIVPRIITIIAACLIFFLSTDFIRHHDGGRYEKINWLNTTFTAWNQTRNYDENGFIVGFLYNLSKLKLAEPEGYDEEKIGEIKEKYQKIKEASEENKVSLKDADYNIVIILNESFYDPTLIEKYYPHGGGDITPNLHRLMDKYSSGYMYTLDYGGGTANIEFEVLTGMTNYWINTVPYTNLIPKIGSVSSIASFAKQNGYETIAIHPYNGGMYKRSISLKNEGFDIFITELEMNHKEHEGDSEYINDKSAYNELVDTLKNNDNKQMITLITMQNHTPYKETTYAKHDFELKVFDDNLERKSSIETYYQTLHESDKYLGEMIAELDTINEKTVVLFFGDHSAGLFDELNDSDDASEAFTLSRLTPYFIYANFDIGKTSLPRTSPNCLVNTMLNKLNVKKPTMNYLLDEICEGWPILASTYLGDKGPGESDALTAYKLTTYDILGGKQYWMNN